MNRTPLGLALAMSILAGMAVEDEPKMTPEEKEKWRREREEADERRRQNAQKAQAAWKAEQDAIAAPFREARRLRNQKKLQQGQVS